MTKRAKVKKDTAGKYQKNGAAAKTGLNTAILASIWGMIVLFTTYKGLSKGKLTIKTPPPGTSHECSRCGHTHPDNRVKQTLFVCQSCGFAENADFNAARVIKKRGIKALIDGTLSVKQKKTVKFTKKQHLGPGLPEVKRAAEQQASVGSIMEQETTVSRYVGTCLRGAGVADSRSSHLNLKG